jgi:pimeloyl-ACP methyl ester carboxylesterase
MHKAVISAAAALSIAGCGPAHNDALSKTNQSVQPLTLTSAQASYFTNNGVTIRYKDIGRGEPVLLLHGWTDRLEMWAGPADSLAREYRVIVPDVRGFGESSKPSDPNEYGRKMVSDMLALLDHLRMDEVHIIGYSMGALISAQLALDNPERVSTVSFVAGPFFKDSATFAAITAPLMDSLKAGHGLAAFFKWQMPTWSDSAIASIVPSIYAANNHDALVASMTGLASLMPDRNRVTTATVPAFAIVSKADRVAESSRYIARLWPNAALVELDTHDHSDIHLAPEVLAGFRALARSVSR